jgi:hypothetical protein
MIRTTVRGGALRRLLGTTLFALATAGASQAAVITFEGNSAPPFNRAVIHEAGYAISFVDPGATAPPGTVQIGRFIDGSNPAACGTNICPTGNASTYLDLFSSGYLDIQANGPDASFRFSGLDASFIGQPGAVYPPTAGAIQVIGFLADGTSDFRQFNLPRPDKGSTVFQRFEADADFAKLQFTQLFLVGYLCNAQGQCSGLDNNPGQYALDNIGLSDQPVSNVPEPATASLLALGLFGLSRARRRA